ncbi:hypothetical protein [Flavobacterium daemonense]|uniref:hypothetical protein n=1 Tax=Flavobacterium daemonense TaxID=1393049 RepID=UPI001186133A|nr:hypothetical protein [Flavobacterium daemonense]KAF2329093.1 hypothetical protein FND99_17340 [Flavobacterium daemonense]
MFRIFFSVLIFIYSTTFSQNNSTIEGKILSKIIIDDTIHFSAGIYHRGYYENYDLSSELKKNNFILKSDFTYPHMYVLNLNSEKNKILFRAGVYFIDSYTKNIQLDSLYGVKLLDGPTNLEYKNKFLPYILKGIKSNFYIFRSKEGDKFDNRLFNYTKNNPSSYVALWFLIDRISSEGYKEVYEKILSQFSFDVRNGQLWKTANAEFLDLRNKSKAYLDFDPKSIDLKSTDFKLQNSQVY